MQVATVLAIAVGLFGFFGHHQKSSIDRFSASPPHHIHHHSANGPSGLTPAQTKSAYQLPTSPAAGAGHTIAIVDAYDSPSIGSDLSTFSSQFTLPACTTANGCFEKHKMSASIRAQSGWEIGRAHV